MTTEAVWAADCLGQNDHLLTQGVPVLFAYVTGTTQNPDIAWSAAQLQARRTAGTQLYRIDQGFGSKGAFDADEFDLEAGAWTVGEVAMIIRQRNQAHWTTRVYCSGANRAALLVACDETSTDTNHTYFRIADWSLNFFEAKARLGGDIYAWQWASPTSNPNTLVPGTSQTLSETGVDLSVIALGNTGGV